MTNMLSRDESVEQLDFALKSAGMGVYSWDLLEGIMRWDTQMHALFGLEPGSFSGKYNDFLALVDSGDRPRLAQEIAGQMRGIPSLCSGRGVSSNVTAVDTHRNRPIW